MGGAIFCYFLLLQALMLRARGKAKQRKGGWVGAGPFPDFPGASPQNSHLCGLAFQARSGIPSTTRPPLSLSFKEAEALETETKLFEDLEFQQLERESRVDEERELAGQGLLRSQAELLRSITKRKVWPPPSPLPQGLRARWGLEANELDPSWVWIPADDPMEAYFTFLSLSFPPCETRTGVERMQQDGVCEDSMGSEGGQCWVDSSGH